MAITHRTRWIVLGILGLIIAGVVLFGPDLMARVIRDRSLKIMEQAAGPRSRIMIGNVNIQLLPGDITWNDLRIEQRIDSADTSWTYGRSILIAGKVDRIAVKGLSIWRLLTWKTLEVRTLAIHGADLELITSDRTAQDSPDEGEKSKNLINTIVLDSLQLDGNSLLWRNVRHDRPSAHTGAVVVQASGLRAELPHGQKKFSLAFNSASATIDSTAASFPPLYDLRVAHVHVAHPDSLVQLRNIALTSRKGPQEYGKVIPYETDLITFTSDSIGIHGLDFSALLNERSLRVGEAHVSGTKIVDFRDKTLKDAPYKYKPMPARLLRQLPFTVCLDSLVVDDLDVEYNEKAEVTNDFGQVTFTKINAVVHGICTVHPEEKPEIHMVATAIVYEKAPVHLDFRTAVFDSSDHFSVHARIGPLPFKVFNAMTNDLILVRTTAGTIGGVDFTFEANKDKGHGRVDVEYSDLKVRIAKRDGTREKNVFKSFLVNQLVYSKNIRGDGNFRHGDFTVDRSKGKQIFNYLWIGLREGMMEAVLPGVVKDAQEALKGAKKAGKGKKSP